MRRYRTKAYQDPTAMRTFELANIPAMACFNPSVDHGAPKQRQRNAATKKNRKYTRSSQHIPHPEGASRVSAGSGGYLEVTWRCHVHWETLRLISESLK